MPDLRKSPFLPAVYAAFALASAVCGARAAQALDTGFFAPTDEADLTTAPDVIKFVMKLEGRGCVPNDNGHGISCYGIVANANHLSPPQARNLTSSQAALIYKRDYWDRYGIGALSPNIRLIAFNIAVQCPACVEPMVAGAHGDPHVLLQENGDRYERLARKHPEIYAGSLKGWRNRQRILAEYLDGQKNLTAHADENVRARTDQIAAVTVSAPPAYSTNYATGDSHREAADARDFVSAARAQDIQSPSISEPMPVAAGINPDHAPMPSRLSVPPAHKTLPLSALIAGLGLIASMFASGDKEKRARKINVSNAGRAADPQSTIRDPRRFTENGNVPTNEAMKYGAEDYQLGTFTEAERQAYRNTFWRRSPAPLVDGERRRVDYAANSHVIIKAGCVAMHGEDGIEDSLRYAAQAWNNNCRIVNAPEELRQKIITAAQKLVETGELPSGFTIEGIGTFKRANRPNQAVRPLHNARYPAALAMAA